MVEQTETISDIKSPIKSCVSKPVYTSSRHVATFTFIKSSFCVHMVDVSLCFGLTPDETPDKNIWILSLLMLHFDHH